MVEVKICGITTETDLLAATEAGADSVGFVIQAPSSKRNLSLSQAKYLITRTPENVNSVIVSIFADEVNYANIYRELDADLLQLHGIPNTIPKNLQTLSLEDCVIGVVNASSPLALEHAIEFSQRYYSMLLDTMTRNSMGGTGVTHDWTLSRKIRDKIYPRRLILAGGLTPENVRKAIQKVKPYGVDISSGVEKSPGVKDHQKMRKFIKIVKEGLQ
ncbi:phosphoribosylanthranilate isomerase [[Eubacterium] cellulosolvens]